MEPWYARSASLLEHLEHWIPGLVVILGTLLITPLTSRLLGKLNQARGLRTVAQLAPSLSNILYVLGLRLFVDVSPLPPKVEFWLDHITYILSVVLGFNLFRRAVLLALEWSNLNSQNSKTLQQGFIPLLKNVITLFIFFSGGIMILKHFSYDVMSLLTALGVGSLAVGLAAKDTLSNMISGFILIIDQNLRPGDRVNLGGTVGDVQEIGLRSTQIRLGDGNTLVVPNADLVNTKILNLSIPSRSTSCAVLIRVPYTVPFSKIREVCFRILTQIDKVAQNKSSWVNLNSLAEGHQVIQIGFWVSEMNDSGAAISAFNEQLLAQLQKENITLVAPFQTISSQ